MNELTYSGVELIYFKIMEPTKVIKIHAENPVVIKKICKIPDEKELVFEKDDDSVISIYFEDNNNDSKIVLQISFTSTISTGLLGCYVSNRDDMQMVSTFFEPSHARKAIPCIDEPCFKCRFKLTIKTDKNWTVISNMPGEITEEDSKITVDFDWTPLMPSYLLHWTICKHSKLSVSLNNLQLSIYAPDTSLCEPSLYLAKDAINYFNNFFNLQYSLPKLDMILVYRIF